MKIALRSYIGVLTLAASLSTAAYAYEACEKYEFAELKSMSQKQLQAEFCKVAERTNDIYKVIGSAPHDEAGRIMRDRNDCWDMTAKISRQPRFKPVKCPGFVPVDPLEAALQK